MEINAIMQALVKDLAEQMRPMVATLIDERIAAASGLWTDLAKHLTGGQLEVMARHINLADLAAELGDNFADDIAEHISLSDLASEISLSDLASELDLEDSIKSFFSDNRATISF